MRMRFRLWHLFLATTCVAIGLVTVDRMAYETVAVEFYNPGTWDRLTVSSQPKHFDYSIAFKIKDQQQPISGFACGHFGPNSLLGTKLTRSSLSELDRMEVQLEFRRRPFLWRPTTTPITEFRKHFTLVLVSH